MVWSSVGDEFAFHADICNLDSGFLETDYNFLQSPGTRGQNMRPNLLSIYIYIYIYIYIVMVQWLAFGTPTPAIRVRFPSVWF